MRRIWLVLLAATLLALNASAQTATSLQTSVSAKSQTSVSAGKSDVQAQSTTSANASQDTRAQSSNKGASAQTSGSASSSTSASAQAGHNSASLSSGTTVDAVLNSSLDAQKNKVGDQVVAHTTQDVKSNGQVIIPKGSKLIGHVTQAQARAKGESESTLGVVFDRAIPKHGPEMPVRLVIQALAAGQGAASSSLDDGGMMPPVSGMGSASGTGSAGASRSGGGLLGGAGSTVGATAGAATNTAGAVTSSAGQAVGATANTATSATAGATGAVTGPHAGAGASGVLNSASNGVIGLKGLALNAQGSNATQGSLIVSSTRNVHLDSGTQMLLRAEAQSQSPSSHAPSQKP